MKHLLNSQCFDESGKPTIHMYMAMMSDYTLFLGETSDDGGRDNSDELQAFEVGLEEELYRVFREERNSGRGMEGYTGLCRESSLAADAVAGNIVSELIAAFERANEAGLLPGFSWKRRVRVAKMAMGFAMAYGFEFWNVYRMHLARRVVGYDVSNRGIIFRDGCPLGYVP